MRSVTKIEQIPEDSIILKNFGKLNYSDTYQIRSKTNHTIDTLITEMFCAPAPTWVLYLLKIRNSIVRIFNLKTGNKDEIKKAVYYSVGSKAGYFTVLDRNDNEIVMGEKDKHLNFRTSVFIQRNNSDSEIYLSTIVQYNNIWGRLYFWPVKPFHRLIIRSLLKKFKKK
jgi:hypothetical protein